MENPTGESTEIAFSGSISIAKALNIYPDLGGRGNAR
jgi:hypothetical protein